MESLDDVAAELGVRAAQVEAAGDQLVRAAASAIWTSVGADAFRAQVIRRRDRCEEIARALRSAASSVRAHADDVAAERARLARVARLVEPGRLAAEAAHAGRAVVRAVGW
jgi:uncharacterized protein YukE